MKINKDGFEKTDSENFARKIWSLAMDWQGLILRSPTSKQLILGLSTHRLTGKKEMVKCLELLGHSVPHHVILSLNSKWFENLPPSHFRFKNIKHLHSTIDNCDKYQETKFQSLQMHDNNRTLYYPLKSTDDSSHYERAAEELALINERETIPKVLPYYHGPRTLPEKFAVFHDNCGRGNILNDNIKKDIVWGVLNDIKTLQEEQPLIGS